MLSIPTLFVVGAGGSAEIGLPLGHELKAAIAKKLKITFRNGTELATGDSHLAGALEMLSEREFNKDVNEVFRIGREISMAMPLAISIDNYLDAHQDQNIVVRCGKVAIAISILESERLSRLHASGNDIPASHFQNIEESWLVQLFKLISEGVKRNNVETIFNNVVFITFNYDRCIERFFVQALQSYYKLSAKDSTDIVSRATIMHALGTVGRLDWQNSNDPVIAFGQVPSPELLAAAASCIRTFTEQAEDPAQERALSQAVDASEVVVFLGFSYQEQNVKLLLPSGERSRRFVLGTTYGVSYSNSELIRSDLVSKLNCQSVRLEHEKCGKVVADYRRSIVRGVAT